MKSVVGVFMLALATLLCAGCGEGGQGKSDPNSADRVGGLSLILEFPEGYAVDRSTGALVLPADGRQKSAPPYVTAVTLAITGAGIETIVQAVPLDTGVISGALPTGTYTFTVSVETTIGVSFGGSTTVLLSPGANAPLAVRLSVNAPPVIEGGLSLSNAAPYKNEAVTVSVVATDLDGTADLTYAWSGGGGNLVGAGDRVVWSASTTGTYSVSVTVSDGHGASVRKAVTITVLNHPPVIRSVTASDTAPGIGQTITLACAADDADNDPLSYVFTDGLGWSGRGASVPYTVNSTEVITFTCAADDGDRGGRVTDTVASFGQIVYSYTGVMKYSTLTVFPGVTVDLLLHDYCAKTSTVLTSTVTGATGVFSFNVTAPMIARAKAAGVCASGADLKATPTSSWSPPAGYYTLAGDAMVYHYVPGTGTPTTSGRIDVPKNTTVTTVVTAGVSTRVDITGSPVEALTCQISIVLNAAPYTQIGTTIPVTLATGAASHTFNIALGLVVGTKYDAGVDCHDASGNWVAAGQPSFIQL
ncbi:MAG: PKD domain-containing protein [Nitrospinae bacterium]|nr:PKD domain-containing protein [Nitrospinota bacterium]